MNRTREKGKMLGVVLMMLFVGMVASQGFALNVPSQTEIGGETVGQWDDTNKIYTLIANVGEGIVVEENGLTLDGNKDMGYTVSGSGNGVFINKLTNVTVRNMNITGFTTGIYVSNWGLEDTFGGHKLIGNTIYNNSLHGIEVNRSKSNTIEGNSVSDNGKDAIFLSGYCSDSIIIDNTLDSNVGRGIMLNNNCNVNYLMRNVITNNNCGLELYTSTGNEIYNNDFIDNTTQVVNNSSGNIFSMPSPIGGNYWDDWTEPEHEDSNDDGFIDDARPLPNGTDLLPLAEPYSEIGFMIRSIIVFFNECLSKEPPTIVPSLDKGRPEEKRMDAFRDLLVKAQDLIEADNYDLACKKLDKALALCDPDVPPPDLIMDNPDVEGNDLETLIAMIVTLKGLLGCQ